MDRPIRKYFMERKILKEKKLKYHGDMTLEKFWLNWFGPFGRELGTNKIPHRHWTDNPQDLIKFIKMCAIESKENEYCRPCWISSQPMRYVITKVAHGFERKVGTACAIEKLFFDFDDDTKYCEKCKKYIKKVDFVKVQTKKGTFCPKCGTKCFEKPRLDIVGKEVKRFISHIKENIMIVGTRKGYHVYIFLCQIFPFEDRNFKFAKKVYKSLQERYTDGSYEFMDGRVLGDLNRFARLPFTAHEKTGQLCRVLDRNLNPTKVRNIEEYRTYGIRESKVVRTIKATRRKIQEENEKAEKELKDLEENYSKNGEEYQGMIRPCFQVRMDAGYMCHGQRLAWLSEIFYAGYNTPQKMLELCKCFAEYKESLSMQQINDYFTHKRWEWKPYRCKTIKEKGWCLESKKCPLWNQ